MEHFGHSRASRALPLIACVLAFAPQAGASQGEAKPVPEAEPDVQVGAVRAFEEFGPRVVKIEVIERGSRTKNSLGTGFFIDDRGQLVTNYHVVSEAIRKPHLYHLEYVVDGESRPAKVLAVDVVHDLAIVGVEDRETEGFALTDARPAQGSKVYSLGHPHDLGLTIVEGTYNGLLEHRLYEQLHFSGAINAGMSGGPALLDDGRVVGVNVATMGNEVGFLVPIRFAVALQARLRRDGPTPPEELNARITQQVLEHQREAFGSLDPAEGTQSTLGPFSVPGRIAPFLRCWASHDDDEHKLYTRQSQQCGTQARIYIDDELYAGSITFRHVYFRSKDLGALRFARLIENQFGSTWSIDAGARASHTEFRCEEANVATDWGPPMRSLLCLRAYRHYAGLYDLVVKLATVDRTDQGMVSTMVAEGVSYETSMSLGKRFLESIKWAP